LHEGSIVKHPAELNVSPPVNRPPLCLRIAAWAAVLVWTGTIFWLSSRTGSEIEELNKFEISDKVAHFVAFFAGAIPAFFAFQWSFPISAARTTALTIAYMAIYGALDETHQLFTLNRSGADKYDWAADALGGTAGALVTSFLYARFARSTVKAPARN
jgi:VanZ family protein